MPSNKSTETDYSRYCTQYDYFCVFYSDRSLMTFAFYVVNGHKGWVFVHYFDENLSLLPVQLIGRQQLCVHNLLRRIYDEARTGEIIIRQRRPIRPVPRVLIFSKIEWD
jgi:hypothetical protein